MSRSSRVRRVLDSKIVQAAPEESTMPDAKALVVPTESEATMVQQAKDATDLDDMVRDHEALEAEVGSLVLPEPTVAELTQLAAVPESATTAAAAAPAIEAGDAPAGTTKDTWIVPGPCTKREKTDAWRSFQCYGTGITVGDYLAHPGHSSRRKARESLRWDLDAKRSLVHVGERPAGG